MKPQPESTTPLFINDTTTTTRSHTFKSSSVLAFASYDPSSLLLFVLFQNGTEYRYTGVPSEIWEELVTASSAGVYFTTVIRKLYHGARTK